ncbi:MAG: hypothetical protein P1P76_12290 [Anaerolineales bacterium]|nr:hypothetical protein [Anaerolineales bacterium]
MIATIEALQREIDSLADGPEIESLPFEGFWVSESEDPSQTAQILVITPDSFYTLRTYDPDAPGLDPSAYEMYAEITSIDEANGHMVLRTQWFRTNGRFGGFDRPTARVTYRVEGDVLRLSLVRSDDGQFPESADSDPYYRQ